MTNFRVGDIVSGSLILARYCRHARYGAGYIARCACGYFVVKYHTELKRGGTSAMCYRCKREDMAVNPAFKGRRTHGDKGTYLYSAYHGMKSRCAGTTKRQDWKERGISVCPEWAASYETFARYIRENLGERPSPIHSLDRIDNDAGYEPGNLRWATPLQQNNNQRPRYQWKKRVLSTPAIEDPVWADKIEDLHLVMHADQLAAHLGISRWKLNSILPLMGKKCIRKPYTLSERDPLI